jgi:hypothetical protein
LSNEQPNWATRCCDCCIAPIVRMWTPCSANDNAASQHHLGVHEVGDNHAWITSNAC